MARAACTGMKPICCAISVLLFSSVGAAEALAQEQDRPGIFFGGTLGGGGAWVDHPDVDDELDLGGYWSLHGGWQVSPRIALGGEFTSWGTDIRGVPVHLHTIGPRLEVAIDDIFSGFFVGGTAGLALTEGDLEARAGGGAAIVAGYRWPIGKWTTLAFEAGAHAHIYDDGAAAFPIAALQLRFHGEQ